MRRDAPGAVLLSTELVVNRDWKGAMLLSRSKPDASDVRKAKCVPLCGKNIVGSYESMPGLYLKP